MSDLATEYHTDFHAWIAHHIALLRQRRLAEIDVDNLVEELETMGKRDKHALESDLTILLAHLLKWQHQPNQRSSSWRGSIIEQRFQILKQLKDSPSLTPYLPYALQEAYPDAVCIAAKETEIPRRIFPTQCNYSLEELIDEDFFPSAKGDLSRGHV